MLDFTIIITFIHFFFKYSKTIITTKKTEKKENDSKHMRLMKASNTSALLFSLIENDQIFDNPIKSSYRILCFSFTLRSEKKRA